MKLDRRIFLKSLGLGTASLAMLPDLTSRPLRKMFPLLIPAEEIIPGMPYWYASTCRECPAGCGVLLKVREGNVIKIEGNPNHPISRGGLCARGQAALQELYHEERLRIPAYYPANAAKQQLDWVSAFDQIRKKMGTGRTALLTGKLSGAQRKLIERWIRQHGNASLVEYESWIRLSPIKANQILFSQAAPSVYFLENADYILSFGADFLETWRSPVGLSRSFADARKFKNGHSAKFVYVGILDNLTAANADEEYKINPTTEALALLALARWIVENDESAVGNIPGKSRWLESLSKFTFKKAAEVSGMTAGQLTHIARDLNRYKNTIVLCGDSLAAHNRATDSQIAVNILNFVLGNYGKTIALDKPNREKYSWSAADFDNFIKSMEAGQISNLIIHDNNPVFSYPNPERLKNALKKVTLKIALATTKNETTALADYILPVHHTIESWGLDEPEKDIYSLVQPGMIPVFDTRQMEDILIALLASSTMPVNFATFLEAELSNLLSKITTRQTFEENKKAVFVEGGVWPQASAKPAAPDFSNSIHGYLRNFPMPKKPAGLTLAVSYSARFFDGRGANKPWLWEIPNAIHHTVWDIPLRLHPHTAGSIGLKEGGIAKISVNNKSIEAPVLITEDIHPSVIAMEIGAGHTDYTSVAVKETGNPISLLSAKTDALSGDLVMFARDVRIEKTDKWRKLVRLQGSYNQGEREIIQQLSLEKAAALKQTGAQRKEHHVPTIYPEHVHKTYDWAMVVDLSACTGCSACAVACYAENNVPAVGKEQCDRGREMAWLRIERFDVDGRSRFLPMMCQQCENAPCETVCPVYATVHSDEGLNVQVYNRCVGTRYCSNNCPYKARRFNYFQAKWPEPKNLMLNPDIYHRPKGVMEKCTFCFQRIRKAKEDAKIEGRSVRDGEIVPACAQSCPTQAITFGNLNDPESKVSKLLLDFRAYSVFEELNTQPSVIYLKGIKHG